MNAAFGPSINDAASNWASFAGPVHLSRVPGGAEQQLGCEPYSFLPPFDATQSDDDAHQGASASNDRRHHQQVVFVRRGRCTFFQKAKLAAQAGAVGVIVANTDDETTFTPSADVSELASSPLVPLLMINNATSRVVENMLTRTPDVQIKTSHKRAEQQRLVINGYTIANAMVRPPT